ncbi:MAG: ABC transporter ATP-binding protein [Flavobacteriales bacterium]|nr:ABC transporter ATP-binding protein [Flavobacteriales bacterium]
MIEAEHIKKSFGDLQVLKDISLNIKKGEIVSIVGASGAGKTTLLQIIGTLNTFSSGKLRINGVEIEKLKSEKLAKFRNQNIGFVFQFHQLLPEFTALENVCIPAYIAGKSDADIKKKALNILEMLNVAHRKDHKPNQLSGGEQQRVAVARALINDPAIILADEPSGNLDSKNAKELHELFFDLRKNLEQTFVIVTHNETLAGMSDRQLLISDGVLKV